MPKWSEMIYGNKIALTPTSRNLTGPARKLVPANSLFLHDPQAKGDFYIFKELREKKITWQSYDVQISVSIKFY